MGLLPEGRRAYARALVDLAELNSLNRLSVPALGIGDGSRTLFERRLVMIMGEGMRYRLGVGGLMGMGLLALATLPGCSAGQAAEELVPNDGVNVTAPAGPPVGGAVSGDLVLPDAPNPSSLPVKEDDPELNAGSPPPLSRPGPANLKNDSASDALVPPLDAPAESSPPKTAAASPEDRIQRLEERFDVLLKELRELKNPAFRKDPDPFVSKAATSVKHRLYTTTQVKPESTTEAGAAPKLTWSNKDPIEVSKKAHRADSETEAVQLTRVTYKLPAGRAEAIAAFLTQNLTDEIEVRVKGDGLQVTATAADQTAIGQFIRLLQTRAAAEVKPPVQRSDSPKDSYKKTFELQRF
jgi:hypothetical protein